MRNQFIALGAMLLLAIAAGQWSVQAAPQRVGEHIVLVPDTLDGMPAGRRWNHALDELGVVENGAIFADAVGRQVLVDYWRGAPSEHDGIFCFVLQGESVLREQAIDVQTRSGAARFNVALLRNGGALRLAASTQCRPEGCKSRPLRLGVAPSSKAFWSDLQSIRVHLWRGKEPVVPVSLVVDYPGRLVTNTDEASQLLMDDFRRVAMNLDLQPARELAGLYRQ